MGYVLEAKETFFGSGCEIAVFADTLAECVIEFQNWLNPEEGKPPRVKRAKVSSLDTGELLCVLTVQRDGSLKGRIVEEDER